MKKPNQKAIKALCAAINAAAVASLKGKTYDTSVPLVPGESEVSVRAERGTVERLRLLHNERVVVVCASDENVDNAEADESGKMPEVKLSTDTKIKALVVQTLEGRLEVHATYEFRVLSDKGLELDSYDNNSGDSITEIAGLIAEKNSAFETLHAQD